MEKSLDTGDLIFFNYDCDWNSDNVFSRIVQVLTRIATNEAQLNSPAENVSKEKETAVHTMALKCIVNIMSSLAEYTHLEDLLPAEGEVEVAINGNGEPTVQLTPRSSERVLKELSDEFLKETH